MEVPHCFCFPFHHISTLGKGLCSLALLSENTAENISPAETAAHGEQISIKSFLFKVRFTFGIIAVLNGECSPLTELVFGHQQCNTSPISSLLSEQRGLLSVGSPGSLSEILYFIYEGGLKKRGPEKAEEEFWVQGC